MAFTASPLGLPTGTMPLGWVNGSFLVLPEHSACLSLTVQFWNDMGCVSSPIWLPVLQVKDHVVFIFVCLPALTVPGIWWALSNYMFCCVIVNMLNDVENSLLPSFVHLWQTQLIAHLTAITAPSPFILAGGDNFIWSFTLHKAIYSTGSGSDSFCLAGVRAWMVTGPVNLCSPIPLVYGPIPAN